ncbi:MAG: class I SAM-dependent methyltransferase [Candidatus Scalindua sp.]|nr:class I SAM-dependent methyltransferase [Candidatus Scalindua sp.]
MARQTEKKTAYAFNNSDIIASYDLDMDVWHPHREKMAFIAGEILPFKRSDRVRILDLGVGSGYLTNKIIEMFPGASIIAVDAAALMIDQAKIRLKAYLGQITFKPVTFQELSEKEKDLSGIDAVVSAFALHHLSREEKLRLFQFVHSILKPNGWFVNCDIFRSAVSAFEELFRHLQYMGVRERTLRMKNQDKTVDQIASEYTAKEKRDGDKLMTVAEEMELLAEAGFQRRECFWKEYREAVHGGIK